MIDPARATAAFLGLALGDAYGRPLEFTRGPAVRSKSVSLASGDFRWTDDTHMALYLAEAVLAQPPGPLDDDAFGNAVGEAFSRWMDDPLTPSTAPGNTCLEGVSNWRATRDWRTSGVTRSDGCGAVMRVVPLAIAYAGAELDRAAEISALVTHAHPNAPLAALAACRLLRAVLERGALDAGLVQEVIAGLPAGAVVARSLRAALEQAEGPARGQPDGWLDEAAIPEGDGGWRSPSAVGLAVAAALRWGGDFAVAVEKAARIDGDSDSVAALAGMFLGAAGGLEVLPEDWLVALPERARIEALAGRLAG